MNTQLLILGRMARRHIGRHHRHIGTGDISHDEYMTIQQCSDEWVALVKYLIQTLDNRDHAVQLAHAAGMPGYINMR